MRADAGTYTTALTRGSAGHAAAFLGAAPAGLRALLAMCHLVAFALFAAGVAYVGAGLADHAGHFAAARHIAGRHPADVGAVDIECNAARHRLGVGFLQAGSRAVVACNGTGITAVDAGLILFMSHDFSGKG